MFFTVPYVKNLSERFKGIINPNTMCIVYKSINTLTHFVKTHKDKLNSMQHCNVVYYIDCADCNASYVGQTCRQLQTRIKKHRRIPSSSSHLSAVAEHRIVFNHDLDWDNIKILNEEPCYYKRLIAEAIFIKKHHGLYLQTEIEFPDNIYNKVLRKFGTE